jgi:pyroglutamyl-peptidase
VSYSDVSTQLPRLLEKHQPDIVLHIGLAGGRKHYAIERSSLRGRYIYRDADGSGLTQEENDEIFPNDTPECIVTGYDYDKVFEAWWQGCKRDVKCKGAVLQASDDVGLYLCGFGYYTTLSRNWRRDGNGGKVLFLHVPQCPEKEDVETGKEVTMRLLESMVAAFREDDEARGATELS